MDTLHSWRDVTSFVSYHKTLISFPLLQFWLELFKLCRVQFTRLYVNWTLISGWGRVGGESNLSSSLRGMSLRNSHLQNSSSSSSTHTCTETFSILHLGLYSDPGNTLVVFLAFSAESPRALYSAFLSCGAVGAATDELLHCYKEHSGAAPHCRLLCCRFDLLLVIHNWNLSLYPSSWEVWFIICRKCGRDTVMLKLLRTNTNAILWLVRAICLFPHPKKPTQNAVGKSLFMFYSLGMAHARTQWHF